MESQPIRQRPAEGLGRRRSGLRRGAWAPDRERSDGFAAETASGRGGVLAGRRVDASEAERELRGAASAKGENGVAAGSDSRSRRRRTMAGSVGCRERRRARSTRRRLRLRRWSRDGGVDWVEGASVEGVAVLQRWCRVTASGDGEVARRCFGAELQER
ncbi:hypothetical protein EUGRSUZ_K01376 [Eucalyptus grandis]|uniref:Uncharacterized protein n=2 Tax=Eucalyptus grandis TaxID=71139 RepID=A0ACC3ITJ4_EUCGR|nr:hypothetical protein EUGRSUZ_K01376 [Eucalyptus grandis]